jgi:hypothetical protein
MAGQDAVAQARGHGDTVTVCGSRRDLPGPDVIRISSFTRHWLRIYNP